MAIALIGGVAAGCGSSGTHRKPPSAGESATIQIERNWTEFFSGPTPAAAKISLLQNGQQFAPVIQAQSKMPLAKHVSARVSETKLTGPTTATVMYTVMLAGKPALKNASGTAIKSGGVWKVSDASFCQLLKLEGAAPPGCPKT